ncbi:TPA: hypothetical protein ACQZF0_000426 [Escherichia coli]|nr:hypothetical protein [Escherichia coli]HBD5112316.1 hypothetical protein [Escherichia coli]HBD5180410.1 hypothetical protein [Escherichia coli]HBN7023238.1 hypothetical protein [Escherichia coli]HCO7191030.1 hypothetical protein [Escherichia coli]
MQYALVKNGIVENMIEWDGVTEYVPGEGFEVIMADNQVVQIGYKFDGKKFISPEKPVTLELP